MAAQMAKGLVKGAVRKTSGERAGLNFVERLAKQLEEVPPAKKAERTREALKVAAARVLEKRGYSQLRAIDISVEAGMSEGIFYKYFKDRNEICHEVLGEFMHNYVPMQRHSFDIGAAEGSFGAILRANIAWFSCARANSQLIRSVFQFQDSESSFAGRSQRVFRDWHDLTLRKVLDHYPDGAADRDTIEILLYALGGMIDEVTRLLWVNPNRSLLHLLERNSITDEDLAEVMTIIWHRTIYPAVPLPEIRSSVGQAMMALGKSGVLAPAA